MMPLGEELTDQQWNVLDPLFPALAVREDSRGRPPTDTRAVMNGVLWILRTEAPWRDLPERFPPYQTCHRHFQEWCKSGTLREVLEALAEDLRSRGKLDLSKCFIDAAFVAVKKGLLRGQDQAGQGYEAHGSGRPLCSSNRRLRGVC
jgi:transposase